MICFYQHPKHRPKGHWRGSHSPEVNNWFSTSLICAKAIHFIFREFQTMKNLQQSCSLSLTAYVGFLDDSIFAAISFRAFVNSEMSGRSSGWADHPRRTRLAKCPLLSTAPAAMQQVNWGHVFQSLSEKNNSVVNSCLVGWIELHEENIYISETIFATWKKRDNN